MHFGRNRIFKRQFQKLPPKLQDRVQERLALLITDESNPLLNNHKLEHPYEGCRSINITGDYRLVYRHIGKDTCYLRAIGTHHQLYRT